MQDFKCVTPDISTIIGKIDEMQGKLQDAENLAKEVMNGINDPNNWYGEAQQVGAVFLDLTLQYHCMISDAENGPLVMAKKAFEDYLNRDAVFYDEWSEYQKLLQISNM